MLIGKNGATTTNRSSLLFDPHLYTTHIARSSVGGLSEPLIVVVVAVSVLWLQTCKKWLLFVVYSPSLVPLVLALIRLVTLALALALCTIDQEQIFSCFRSLFDV